MSFLFMNELYAQSCDGIPDGEIKRLDQPGKSLENFRTQDQDGLGTCYANTASVMLQSRLPGHPEVSYLNLAFMYAEKHEAPGVRQNGKDTGFKKKKLPTDDDSFLVDGGFSCETIMAAKERGGVCKRNDVALEKMFHSSGSSVASDSTFLQKEVLSRLSKYYDGIFKDFGREESKSPKGVLSFLSPEQKTSRFDDYKAALKKVLTQKKEQYNREQCLKPDTKNAEAIIENIIARIYQISNDPRNSKNKMMPAMLATQRKLGSAIKIMTSRGYEMDIDVHESTKEALKDYIKEISENPAVDQEAALFKTISKISPAFNQKVFMALGGFSDVDKVNLTVDYERYVKKDVKSCMDQAQLEYFVKDDGLKKDFQNDGCLSQYADHADNIRQLVTTLDKVNLKNIDSLYGFLMELPDMNYEQAMMKVVGPDCPDNKKIPLPNDLHCESGSFFYPDSENATAATDAAFLRETKTKLKDLARESMQSGSAVGLSICTGFWNKDNPNQFYNKTKQCPTSIHGYHAVTMVGYRCRAGKMDYLIQNSWGDWAQSKERFPEMENGKAWISEEDMAKNTYRYDRLK